MDKFVRHVDGQTRDANSKEEAKQPKHACMVSKGEALQQKQNREEEQKAKKAQQKQKGQGPGRPRKAVGPVQQPTAPPVQPYQSETRTAQRKRKSRGSKPAVSVRPGQLKRNWWRPHIIKDILWAVRHCKSYRGAVNHLQLTRGRTFEGLTEGAVHKWFEDGAGGHRARMRWNGRTFERFEDG
eukprot:1157735-Pelagomonas_calceolata.AAC.5